MLKETGRIVDVRDDSIWVETIQRSTCGTCVAQKGCGQSLLQKMGAKPSYLRVPLAEHKCSQYQINDQVLIGIPEDIVLKSSLLLYLLPLLFLLVFSGIAHIYAGNDVISILSGVTGFFTASVLLRWYSNRVRNDQRHQPFIIEDELIEKLKVNL